MNEIEIEVEPEVDSQHTDELILSLDNNTNTLNGLYSYKVVFIRGIVQGLGIVIGSTIIAGIGYTILIQFINPQIIYNISIDSAVEQSLAQ